MFPRPSPLLWKSPAECQPPGPRPEPLQQQGGLGTQRGEEIITQTPPKAGPSELLRRQIHGPGSVIRSGSTRQGVPLKSWGWLPTPLYPAVLLSGADLTKRGRGNKAGPGPTVAVASLTAPPAAAQGGVPGSHTSRRRTRTPLWYM